MFITESKFEKTREYVDGSVEGTSPVVDIAKVEVWFENKERYEVWFEQAKKKSFMNVGKSDPVTVLDGFFRDHITASVDASLRQPQDQFRPWFKCQKSNPLREE